MDAAAADQLRCIALATGGTYRDAPDAGALTRTLTAVANRAFRSYVLTGEVVRGTADEASAPLVTAGVHYQDSIRDGQVKWYALSVAPDELLTVYGTVIAPAVEAGGPSQGFWEVRLVDPNGVIDGQQNLPSAGAGVS